MSCMDESFFFVAEFDVPNATVPYYRRFEHDDYEALSEDLLQTFFKLQKEFDDATGSAGRYYLCEEGRAVRRDVVIGVEITGPYDGTQQLPAHLREGTRLGSRPGFGSR